MAQQKAEDAGMNFSRILQDAFSFYVINYELQEIHLFQCPAFDFQVFYTGKLVSIMSRQRPFGSEDNCCNQHVVRSYRTACRSRLFPDDSVIKSRVSGKVCCAEVFKKFFVWRCCFFVIETMSPPILNFRFYD
jgi:hypothetical protein